MRVNVNMSPPGGYVFKETDGTVIRAGSWRGVMRRVAKYRVNAKLPPGDPEAEVMVQACRDNPALCIHGDKAPIPPQTRDPRSAVKLRGLQWLGAWGKQAKTQEGISFVSGAEAKRRADVCAKCPHNVKLPEGCGSCRKARAALQEAVVGSHRAIDSRLGACDLLGSDLPSAVHLDEVREHNAALPDACWRKATL